MNVKYIESILSLVTQLVSLIYPPYENGYQFVVFGVFLSSSSSILRKKKDTFEANQTYCNKGIDIIMDGILVNILTILIKIIKLYILLFQS